MAALSFYVDRHERGRHVMRICIYLFVSVLWGIVEAYGQQGGDSLRVLWVDTVPILASADTLLSVEGRNQRIGFNSFTFNNGIWLSAGSGRQRVEVKLQQNALYNTGLGLQTARFVQQDYVGYGEHTLRLGRGPLTAGHRFGGYWFAANEVRQARYEGLVRYNKQGGTARSLAVEVSGGAVADLRGSIENRGPTVGARLWGRWQGRDTTLRLGWQATGNYAWLGPRLNAYLSGTGRVEKALADYGAVLGYATLMRRRVEDYYQGLVQSTVSDTMVAGVQLSTRLSNGLEFRTDNQVVVPVRHFNYRTWQEGQQPRQNTGFGEVNVATRQTIYLTLPKLRQSFSLEAGSRNRSYDVDNNLALADRAYERVVVAEKVKDIEELSLGYLYTGMWQMARRTSLSMAAIAKLMRLSTPSDLNDQDRDETFYSADASLRQRVGQFLNGQLRVSGSQKEVVFIRGTQSAQNFTERIIRLEPTVSLNGRSLLWTASYGVWATYNVRSFAQEQDKNRANRIWVISQTMRYRFGRGWQAQVDFLRRENRIAQLDWERFAERPIDTVVITEVHPRLGWQRALAGGKAELMLMAGYKLFRQDRRYMAGVSQDGGPVRESALHQLTLQHGPSCSVLYTTGQRGQVSAEFWLQRASTTYDYRLGTEPFIGQVLSSADLDRREAHYYLFFSISGRYLLGK